MKRIIILELCFLFLATTFQSDRLTGWVQQTIPRPDLAVKDLQFVDTLTGFMVQSRYSPDTSFISMTTDGGNNWTTAQLVNYYLTSLHFIDKNIGYCAGAHGSIAEVLKTTDGGNSWFNTTYVSSFIYLNDVMFINRDTGWVTSDFVVSGGLWRTTDGGISWQMQLNDSYNPSKIFFVNSNTGWVIGNSGINLYKTTNCGVNWNLQANLGNVPMKDIFFVTQDTGWIVKSNWSSQNSIVMTTNGGNNWLGVNSPITSASARLYFVNNKKGWAGDAFSRIVATIDGFNWGTQYSPIYQNYNVSFVDSLHGWAGASGLVHTTDGGGTIVSANEEKTEIPKEFSLEQNYPNPFNQSSIIQFKVPGSKFIKLVVYDLSGREVKTLVNEYKQAGTYQERFDAKDLPSGIYFYRLTSGDFSETKKMILTK